MVESVFSIHHISDDSWPEGPRRINRAAIHGQKNKVSENNGEADRNGGSHRIGGLASARNRTGINRSLQHHPAKEKGEKDLRHKDLANFFVVLGLNIVRTETRTASQSEIEENSTRDRASKLTEHISEALHPG